VKEETAAALEAATVKEEKEAIAAALEAAAVLVKEEKEETALGLQTQKN